MPSARLCDISHRSSSTNFLSVLRHCWLGVRKGIPTKQVFLQLFAVVLLGDRGRVWLYPWRSWTLGRLNKNRERQTERLLTGRLRHAAAGDILLYCVLLCVATCSIQWRPARLQPSRQTSTHSMCVDSLSQRTLTLHSSPSHRQLLLTAFTRSEWAKGMKKWDQSVYIGDELWIVCKGDDQGNSSCSTGAYTANTCHSFILWWPSRTKQDIYCDNGSKSDYKNPKLLLILGDFHHRTRLGYSWAVYHF